MCNYGAPYFVLNRTKKEPVNEIQCHSLSSSPRRPVSLENLEMENSQGRYNRRAVSFIVALSMINSVQYQFCTVAVWTVHMYINCIQYFHGHVRLNVILRCAFWFFWCTFCMEFLFDSNNSAIKLSISYSYLQCENIHWSSSYMYHFYSQFFTCKNWFTVNKNSTDSKYI